MTDKKTGKPTYLQAEMEKLRNTKPTNPRPDSAIKNPRPVVNVQLVRIDVPFWNMVTFMVTAAIAAIPAVIILTLIAAFVVAMIGGIK